MGQKMGIREYTVSKLTDCKFLCNNAHSENNLHPEGTKFSISMFTEQWTYCRVREQSVCNNAHSEEVQKDQIQYPCT